MSKYSPEFKEKVVREYLDSTIGLTSLASKYSLEESMIRFWCQRYKNHGPLTFQKKHSVYSSSFKLKVLKHQQAHSLSYRETAAYFDIRSGAGVVSLWQKLYDEGGLPALEPRRKGRPKKMSTSLIIPNANGQPEEQELQKLRKEVEYLRAENAYLKSWTTYSVKRSSRKRVNSNQRKSKHHLGVEGATFIGAFTSSRRGCTQYFLLSCQAA